MPDASWVTYTDSSDPARGIRCAGVDEAVLWKAWKAYRWLARLVKYVPELFP